MGKIMGRRNSLSNLMNLQRFRHHKQSEEEATKAVKPVHKVFKRVRSPSSSTVEEEEEDDVFESSESNLSVINMNININANVTPTSAPSSLNNKMMRRHSTGNHTKSVHFGDCQIRSYPQVLGDHPYCSMGCPVELGWEYNKEEFQAINDFEEHRDHQRRRKGALLLSPEERRTILSESNSDLGAIRKACRRQCTRKAQRKIQREFFSN
ncbi:MAG: hypothetical protein SGBAC_010866 [Bacillariaceae sp.]